ncbi:MAG: hypothetical protein GY790_16575, partial [Bacteroidetes bacterium]|nr:hypothetical protein [Bacteroidota bacterium]
MGIDFRNGNVCGMSGDGLVPAESARLDGAGYVEDFCGKHSDYHTRSDVREKITEILHDDSLAPQNIVQASSARTLTPLLQEEGNSMNSAENTLTAFHWSEPISDTISAGGIKSHPTHIEPDITKAIFVLQGECELDLVVTSPSGATIDPFDPGINSTSEIGYISYEIPNPEPGQWTLELTEPGMTERECTYAIKTLMETDLFVGVGTDRDEYQPNDPMKIYAYVQDGGVPLGEAAVTSEIQKPDASSVTIALFDDGNHDDGDANDGIYANTFEDSSVRGAYDILVTATIPKDGKTYSRSAWTTVWVDLFPDLAVSDSDIAFSNINPAHGDPVTITATIHNIGDTDANDVNILFFDGDPAESGVAIGEKIVDLAAGTITDLSVSWKAVHGIHTMHVIISPFNDFLEQRYDNNRASADITVEDPELPVADAGPDQVALIDTPVFFDGSGSTDNAGIVNYTWDIDTSVDSDGDGIPDNDVDLTGVHPVYAGGYHSTGTYIVKLSV